MSAKLRPLPITATFVVELKGSMMMRARPTIDATSMPIGSGEIGVNSIRVTYRDLDWSEVREVAGKLGKVRLRSEVEILGVNGLEIGLGWEIIAINYPKFHITPICAVEQN